MRESKIFNKELSYKNMSEFLIKIKYDIIKIT
jgi:hypothetical protein